MKKLFYGLLLLGMFNSLVQAQSNEFNDVKKFYLRNIQAITENNEVKGYFTFYFLDKVNKKENLYALVILDNNLQQTHYEEIVMSKDRYLVSNAYNGETFCFAFVNTSTKLLEYVIYNKSLQEVGKYKLKQLRADEYTMMMANAESDQLSGGLAAVPGKGYIHYGIEEYTKDKRVSIEMFDNTGEQLWTANSGAPTKKSFETAAPYYADENIIISNVSTRPKLLSSNVNLFILGHDPSNGNEIFRIEMTEGEEFKYMSADVMMNKNNNQLIISGEYFKKGDNYAKDKSQGFFIRVYDISGNLVSESLTSWTKDVAKLMPAKKKGEFKDMDVTIHRMVAVENGSVFAIGEQFKKSASGKGIALTAVSTLSNGMFQGNTAMTKIELHDMMVFEFDNTYELKSIKVVDKEKTNVDLPQGYGLTNSSFALANVLKAYGWFDYSFTTLSGDRKTFNSVYINYDREKGSKSKYVIGNISYTKENTLVTDAIPLDSKPTNFAALPAKPGYIAIFEYFKKEKKVSIRLEKLNL